MLPQHFGISLCLTRVAPPPTICLVQAAAIDRKNIAPHARQSQPTLSEHDSVENWVVVVEVTHFPQKPQLLYQEKCKIEPCTVELWHEPANR